MNGLFFIVKTQQQLKIGHYKFNEFYLLESPYITLILFHIIHCQKLHDYILRTLFLNVYLIVLYKKVFFLYKFIPSCFPENFNRKKMLVSLIFYEFLIT